MTNDLRQALCCSCGNLRAYKRARNLRGDWGDRNWERSLGDLKCLACNKVTTHALLDDANDWDEKKQLVALGDDEIGGWSFEYRERIRDEYRRGLPRNPLTKHIWWKGYEDRAREAGNKRFQAMCGEWIDVPEVRSDGVDITQQRAPKQVGNDDLYEQEYEDLDTGLWWTPGDCLDCLRQRHASLLRRQRKALAEMLIKLVAVIDDVNPEMIEVLNEYAARALPGAS